MCTSLCTPCKKGVPASVPVRSFNHRGHQAPVSGPWFTVTARQSRSLATMPGALSSFRCSLLESSSHLGVAGVSPRAGGLAGQGRPEDCPAWRLQPHSQACPRLALRMGSGDRPHQLGSAAWLPACSATNGTVPLGYHFPVAISTH